MMKTLLFVTFLPLVLCFSQVRVPRPASAAWGETASRRHGGHSEQSATLGLDGTSSSALSASSRQRILDHVQTHRRHRLTTSMVAANGEVQVDSSDVRNMFHDYNKPLVLVGSSVFNEIHRLATSLQGQEFFGAQKPKIVVPKSLASAADDDKSITYFDDSSAESVADFVQSSQWPDIIVVDTASPTSSGGDTTGVATLVRQLYHDEQLLSIYVNVQPKTAAARDATAQARLTQLETDLFVPFSDYELCLENEGNGDDAAAWEHVEWELCRLLARARLIPAIPGDTTRSDNTAHLTMGRNTFFLSLSFPDIRDFQPTDVSAACLDVDAMEYRADLLACRDSRFDLLYGMQWLRRLCRPNSIRAPSLPLAGGVLEDVFPIVYTVRTQHQAGTYPDDDEGIAKMFEMLEWGLRAGAEVLDVESAWDPVLTSELLTLAKTRYSSQILGSHHVVGEEVTLEEAVLFFERCALDGRAHGAKVVLSTFSDENDRMAYEAGLIASELAREDGEPVIPNIALVLGDAGQFSRVINLPFTPVTHESLPVKAAPGQMTSMEIMTTRLLTKIFERKKYAILGHNIAYSVSPQMHSAAFRACKLPHEYVRADTESVEDFVKSDFFQSDDFGGTSVTIPHKQAIVPYIDVLSDAAKEIGSVNTVIAREEYADEEIKRVLYGDNTDWRGIYNPINRRLGGSANSETDFALILGAGGTARAAAYVAKKLGLSILYSNRTPSKAAILAESFGGMVLDDLNQDGGSTGNSLGEVLASKPGSTVRVVISTLPAASEFVLPAWLLESEGSSLPIVFDVNYKPYTTKLLEQATNAGCSVVRGSEMLWEQGVGQFELWEQRTAPYAVMKEAVLSNCLP